MNNEELVEEIRKLRNEIGLLRTELRAYISNNEIDNEVINKATKEEVDDAIDDVVYGSTQANPDEPSSIVASDLPRVDDNFMYGNDEANYYGSLDRKIVQEKVKSMEDNKEVSSQVEVPEEDRSMYIPGTNILKPRDRNFYETDDEYVKYLEQYYEKYFPTKDFKGLANINPDEPKGLALLDDVKKTDEIKNVEEAIKSIENNKDDGLDNSLKELKSNIPDNYDLDGAPIIGGDEYDKSEVIDANAHPEVLDFGDEGKSSIDNSDDKSEVIEFNSEEEKEAFEKAQSIDYKKDNGSKTKKIGKIRKALKGFKEVLKKHGKKIIAGVLVTVATIGAATSIKSCSYDKQDDLSESKDNPKSNTVNYEGTVPSVSVADSFEAKINEAFEKHGNGSKTDSKVKADENVEEISQKKNENFNISDSTNNGDLRVGDPAEFTGDYLYANSYNAENNIDPLTPFFPGSDNRKVSLAQYKGPNGETATAYTKEDQKVFEDSGWTPVAYNLENLDRDGLTHEGWVNPSDVMEVTVKSK